MEDSHRGRPIKEREPKPRVLILILMEETHRAREVGDGVYERDTS